jgi:ribokinase
MTGTVALFAGDISLDLTMMIARVPEPDEKVHVGEVSESTGGVIANAAVACVRAGTPARVLCQLGEDAAGEHVLREMTARDIQIADARRIGTTCRVVVLIEPHGEKRLLLYPGNSLSFGLAQAEAASLADIGWMHTAVYDGAAAACLIGRCRDAGIPWSIDLEPATFPEGVETLAPHLAGAGVVFCNSRAAGLLEPEAAERLLSMGVQIVVLTEGPEGATWCGRNERFHVAAPEIICRDTTGAGDCLAGWLIAGIMQGLPHRRALEDAVFAASLSCTKRGAQLSYPNRNEIATLTGTTAAAGLKPWNAS